ncbi:hypothetical protein DFH09DRAFT_1477300 [Mycena vulgaris]|nr:hypothetical protein DFH09DRAFT_1477300 [Mycena vulgaris]
MAPKKSTKASAPTAGPPPTRRPMNLRPVRAAKPGGPDMPRSKRTSEAVQQEKAAKEEEKQAEEEKSQQGATDDTAPIDPFSDGPGSADDYIPELEPQPDDELMDPSEDEADPPSKPSARSKKPAKGSLRRAVDDERVKQAQPSSENMAQKRKQPPAEKVYIICASKAKETAIGGLRADWGVRGRTPLPALDVRGRSQSGGSAMSVDARGRSQSAGSGMGGYGPPGSDSSALGGLESEQDDGYEKDWATGDKAKAARVKVTSFAGIVDTNAPGLVPLRRANADGSARLKKAQITLAHIPSEIRKQFRTDFTPTLLQYVGTLTAWTEPTASNVTIIWNRVFPTHPVVLDDPADELLLTIILKLAEDRLYTWRHNLADVVIEVLLATWKAMKLSDAEIANTVDYYLEGDSDRSRVFYYLSYEDPESGEPSPKGIFQGYVFSRVMAVHIAATAGSRLADLRFDAGNTATYPRGVVTLVVQAIKRGLNYMKSGKLVIPPRPLGTFSKSNWGDHSEFREGQIVPIPSTSAIAAVVNKLSAKQWAKIVAAATVASTVKSVQPVIDVDSSDGPPADDFDVIDNDSDWYVPHGASYRPALTPLLLRYLCRLFRTYLSATTYYMLISCMLYA